MITQRTKRQLLVFLLISLLGTAYVGARYARLDRLVVDTSYEVTAQFEPSGAGEVVVARGQTIARQLDAAHQELADLAELRAGHLRIGTFPTAGRRRGRSRAFAPSV